MEDQTDVSTGDDSGGIFSSLSDLASSAISSVGGAAASKISGLIAGTSSTPSPDLTAKAATPGGTSRVSVGAISLPIILVGGAVLAFLLMKRR